MYFGELTDGMHGDEALAEVHRLTGAVPRLNARINPPPDAERDIPRQVLISHLFALAFALHASCRSVCNGAGRLKRGNHCGKRLLPQAQKTELLHSEAEL